MAKHNITNVNGFLVITLLTGDSDFAERVRTFSEPSTSIVNDRIKIYESGIYKMSLSFIDINEIGGVAPTDLADANDKILDLYATP